MRTALAPALSVDDVNQLGRDTGHNRHAAERELGAARVAEAIARRRREHRADAEAAVLDE